MHRAALVASALCFALTHAAAAGENWPGWRGPHGTGVAAGVAAPLSWSKDEGVAWKTPLPGPGNSTPVVWGDRVFVSCATDGGRRRMLLAFSRKDGAELWRRTVEYEQQEATHKTNPHCSALPATDGGRVVVWHGSAGLFCYDLEGKQLWQRELGKFDHIWGNAASPVLHEDLVILNAGPGVQAFLGAFNKETGEDVWRREIEDSVSEKAEEYRGSWSTPTPFGEGGKTLLALSMPQRLLAFDPADGRTVWFCQGVSKLLYTSPLVGRLKDGRGVVVAMSGYHGPAIGVQTGGAGDVTQTHRLWLHDKKNPQRVGSGVIVDGDVYLLNEPGIAWCFDAETGERRWEKRLGGTSWSSICHVAGRLYAMNADGTTFVLEVNPRECKVLAENHLEETTRPSHAFASGQVFIRTYEHLWCLE